MKKELTPAELRAWLSYDPETGAFHWIKKPNKRIRIGSVAGTVNRLGYVMIKLNGGLYSGHRLAWLHVHGRWPDFEVDHRDLDRANNRIKNLRAATRDQNAWNTPAQSRNKLGVKGVRATKNGKRFAAAISTRHLGTFDTQQMAAEAYASAVAAERGEFGRFQ